MKWLLILALISPAFGTTYYVSKSLGLDTHTSTQAQSKSTPWAHLPGMLSCSNSCSSYSPVAGDQFILYGGDTWVATDLGVSWSASGSSGSPIYIGVDQTWYSAGVCGASFCRPIWTCGGMACSGTGTQANFFINAGSYVTLDNIEMTGLFESSGSAPNYVESISDHQIYEHLYIHGWSHGGGATDDASQAFGGNAGYTITGLTIHDNVVDGSDTSEDMLACMFSEIPIAYNNVCRYVTNGFEAAGDNWHDNLVEFIVSSYNAGAHQNAMFQFGPAYASNVFLYNNVIRNNTCSVCGGVVKLWLSGNNSNTATAYGFNNVIYNNTSGNLVNLAGHNAVNYGTWNLFNNTIECGTDGATGTCASDAGGTAGMTFVVNSKNNHWLSSTSPALSCTYSTCTTTTDLLQSVATANGQGYTSGSTYAFQPTSGSGGTVGTGTNEQALCTTINGLDTTAGAACTKTTGYACVYNTGNHTVTCPNDTETARPASAAWDIGAYEFSAGSSPQTFGAGTILGAGASIH